MSAASDVAVGGGFGEDAPVHRREAVLDPHGVVRLAGGHEAAFVFAITVGTMRIEPIEVMTFNSEGLITSMKAYWGPADVTQQ